MKQVGTHCICFLMYFCMSLSYCLTYPPLPSPLTDSKERNVANDDNEEDTVVSHDNAPKDDEAAANGAEDMPPS